MDNPFAMGRAEPSRNGPGDLERLVERKRASLDARRERFTFQLLHGDARSAIIFQKVMDGADVGMI